MVEDWQDGKTLAECNLYMLNNEIMCDVTFLVGRREDAVMAHSYILQSRAPKVASLYSDQRKFQSKLVILPDVDAERFKQYLRFVYTGDIDITSRSAIPLIPLANKFGPRALTKRCFDQILSELTPENACNLLELGHEYNEQYYICKCMEFVSANASDVLKSRSFTSLCQECVEKVIKADDLYTDELTVFNALLRWADSRCSNMKIQPLDQNRRQVLGDMIFHVRYTQMGIKEFTEKVSTKKILANDEKIKIFRYFHGSTENLPGQINKAPRRKRSENSDSRIEEHQANHAQEDYNTHVLPLVPLSDSIKQISPDLEIGLLKVSRFRLVDGSWKNNGPDAISFKCSNTIRLCGVQVFAPLKGPQLLDLQITLFGKDENQIHRDFYKATCSKDPKLCSVLLKYPVQIQADEVYTIQTHSKGPPVHCGRDGVTPVIVEDVRFNFITSSKSLNGTDVTIGQIPALLFKKL